VEWATITTFRIEVETPQRIKKSTQFFESSEPMLVSTKMKCKLSGPIGLATLVMVFALASSAEAQRSVSTITMESGLQYEGDVYGAEVIASGKSVFKDYGLTAIVRIFDGLREVYVTKRRVAQSAISDRNELEIPIFQRSYRGQELTSSLVYVGPFNDKGHREFVAAGPSGPIVFTQAITKLNPRYCELEMLPSPLGAVKSYQWSQRIATSTVPTEVLRNLLRREITDKSNSTDYIRVADFLIQTNRYNAAQEEIQFIKSEFPGLDERLKEDLEAIRQAQARQVLREVRLRTDAGQLNTAMALARAVNKDDLALTILAEFAELEEKYEASAKRIVDAREKVNACLSSVAELDASQTEAVKQLKTELETELNQTNVLRLDAFLRLADDPTLPAQQKLALILSGWLMGSSNATENLAIAQELFRVRDLIRKYLMSAVSFERDEIVEELKKFETGKPQQITALIQQMKPVDAPDLSRYNGEKPIEFTVQVPRPAIESEEPPHSFRCLVHLPTEYDPYRNYPLLITLPTSTQSVDQNLEMWCGIFSPALNQRVSHPERNGYIVMAVDWRLTGQSSYRYSAIEHSVILKALRQALRKFSVDSDRVFLAGHADGGDAAYDIGLSHPEHWAGIVAVSAGIKKYAKKYHANEHWSLPVYSVCGGRDNATIATNQDIWSKWVGSSRYVDATVVWYHGRGAEMFEREELPETFKWMNAQRRRWPDRSSFSINCTILRPWDNYFWFIELDPRGLPQDKLIWPEAWTNKNSVTMSAEAGYKVVNRIRINRATKPLTVWLSSDFIDFSQRLTISGQVADFKGTVEPSTRVLLEDVRQRGDRLHPYSAKLKLVGLDWTVN
jgi:pimeloyl-ACP methyl ester carboxylesterase